MKQTVGMKLYVKVSLYVFLGIGVLFALFPFLWMILMSFKTSTEILEKPLSFPAVWNLNNYKDAFHTINYLRLYSNTIIIAVGSQVFGLTITFMSSFAFSKMEFKSIKTKRTLYYFLIAGLTISGFILLFPIYRITSVLKLRDTLVGLVLPYIAMSISFNTLLLVSFLEELPKEIDEAAIIDGCTLFQLCTQVVLPMAKPAITTLMVFNVLYIFNEYPIASILLDSSKNYTLSMSASLFKGLFSVNYGATIASSLLIIIPELIFYGFFQRYIVDGMTAGAVKG